MVRISCQAKGSYDSSAKKFLSQDVLGNCAKELHAEETDIICIFAGELKHDKTLQTAGKFRAEVGHQLGLRGPDKGYKALWVVDFPLLEWNEEEERYTSMHHPFTSPKPEDMKYIS
eukprot:UN23978